MPLSILGSFLGFKMTKIRVPIKPSRIASEVKYEGGRPNFLDQPYAMFTAGIIPVITIMFTIWIVLDSINGPENIHVISWIFVVSLFCFILAVIEVALIGNYLFLCWHEYNWWWRAYMGGAASGIIMLVIMLFYAFADLQIEFFTTLVSYVVACVLASTLLALMSASVAVYSALQFNITIYGYIKQD